ncbi:hypothetical protein [Actinomycetospora atypica]|uniref:SAV-6107-like HEPN domain-containing protein n=1 Tax=Actinomycetospora atypica TaxID=1290095 RepID=A0ABV9YVN1_9PSEU
MGRAAGPVTPPWRALSARALEALAGARCTAVPRPARDAAEGADAVDALERGVAVLALALGEPVEVPDVTGARTEVALIHAARLTSGLGEAARALAWAATATGQEPAAEVADAVMSVALTLRILAELAMRAVPPTDPSR